MLLIDGVKYEVWAPPSEDEFERIVKEHAQDIFGEEAEFFNKQRLESELGKGSVPDGFVVIFGTSSRWYIVEAELSFHDVHKHIVEQHSRFIMGIRSSETKNKIVQAIYNEIDKDASRKQKLKKAIEPDEVYRFLHEVISKPPVLTIIIEKPIKGLDETLKALSRDTISDIKVVEFQTFVRKGVDSGAHAHLFEPLCKATAVQSPRLEEYSPVTIGPRGLKPTAQEYYQQPILEVLMGMGGRGRVRDILVAVKAKVEDKINQKDFERLPSGEIRWENYAKWQRKRMIQEGLLRGDFPKGVWEVTQRGRGWLMERL